MVSSNSSSSSSKLLTSSFCAGDCIVSGATAFGPFVFKLSITREASKGCELQNKFCLKKLRNAVAIKRSDY